MRGEFYKMDFRAWNTGTVDLTLEQEAAYLRLCHAMYDAQGPVPDSVRLLMGIFRCGNTKAVSLVRQLVEAGKIQRTEDGLLTNRRVSEELATRERVSSERRAAGKRGGTESGATRANTLKNNDADEAIASTSSNQRREEKIREETPPNPSSDQGSEAPALFDDKVIPIKQPGPTPAQIEAAFDRFWETYPKRDGSNPRKLAHERFTKAIRKGAKPEAMIAGALGYAALMTRTGKIRTEYVQQAAVWLNRDGWLDDYEPTAPPNTKWHMV